MYFGIDIDGTIAVDAYGRHGARYVSEQLALGISRAALARIRSFREFCELPAVQFYRQEHEEQFQQACNMRQDVLELQTKLVPVASAALGVTFLARFGRIAYLSCRSEQRTPGTLARTRAWLRRYGFPEPDQVYLCQHYPYKLLEAYQLLDDEEPLIIIDDHADKLAMYSRVLQVPRRTRPIAEDLFKRLVLVNFACDAPPVVDFPALFPLEALPSWQEKDLLMLMQTVASFTHALYSSLG
ncbi:hypothetical protein EPA93_24380 [Ktedonosporobacter rubrisoli]|uniref:HAD family hydrolase n=1 Tax=Ktedonosporobacter rubrisoli TaxID=2509675 RepID=A0A4P6JTN6_KTERU|nr:hypothetical protein [Ktedonosporobacter rubrisoli]QBD78949.1 hypothetical protein EPA93_24380 [Ktedonosporobacter rubrisoli]